MLVKLVWTTLVTITETYHEGRRSLGNWSCVVVGLIVYWTKSVITELINPLSWVFLKQTQLSLGGGII